MNTLQLIQLSSQLDGALNQFALVTDARGEYPWQAQQREKRTGRRLKMAAGAGVLAGAGIYGHQSIMNRAQAAGPVRARDAYKAVGSEVADKAKAIAAPAAARVGAYGGKLAASAKQGYKQSGIKGAGKLLINALKRVRFSSAERLVELEAQLDGALVEFDESNDMLLRGTVGSPLASAMKARKGAKWEAYKEQWKHGVGQSLKGGAIGAGIGAVGGAGGQLILGAKGKPVRLLKALVKKSSVRKTHGKLIGGATAIGAGGGAYVGSVAGGLKGNFDKRSTEIHRSHK